MLPASGSARGELPGNPFWWEAADGSRVLAYRIPHEYCSPRADIAYHIDKAVAQLPPGLDRRWSSTVSATTAAGPPRPTSTACTGWTELGTTANSGCPARRPYVDAVRAVRGRTCRCGAATCSTTPPAATPRTPASRRGCGARSTRSLRGGTWATRRRGRGRHAVSGRRSSPTRGSSVLVQPVPRHPAGTSIEPAYEDARDQLGEAARRGPGRRRWTRAIAPRIASRRRRRSRSAAVGRVDQSANRRGTRTRWRIELDGRPRIRRLHRGRRRPPMMMGPPICCPRRPARTRRHPTAEVDVFEAEVLVLRVSDESSAPGGVR